MKVSIEQVENGYIISDDAWGNKNTVYNTIAEALLDIFKRFGIDKNLIVT